MNLFRFDRRSRTALSRTRRSSGVSFLQPKPTSGFNLVVRTAQDELLHRRLTYRAWLAEKSSSPIIPVGSPATRT